MKHTLIPLVLAVAMGSGCIHTNTKLPGVLDLRSDGSDAAPSTEPFKGTEEISREGFGSYINGEGLKITGDKVVIEDRNWHLVGLVHIVGDMAAAEYAALPKGTALRSVKIGDALTGTDVVLEIVPSLLAWIPIVGLINLINLAPHMTITMTGTRIQSSGGGGGAVEPPPPTDGGTPAVDPNAPATTAPGT
jgi:hypothetical protein